MTSAPAPAGRPRFDIAQIVRAHRAELEAKVALSVADKRVLSAIALCRTSALGGHLDVCRSCGHEHPAYNSCRNRHCPQCQALAQEKWIGARAERLVPCGHFHVVFTLPSELRPLARYAPRVVYDALFAAASETLLALGKDRLGITFGLTMVLHTWTRELTLHPHLHLLVTAGGVSLDQTEWRSVPKYLFPLDMMGTVFRAKVLEYLNRAYRRGELERFPDFADPEAFDRLMARAAKKRWVVYAKKPFPRVDHVLGYLGRYTHRVGIANSRITDVTQTSVTFRTKNGKAITVTPVEFLSRFLLHVLPDGFKKIRHAGLYASGNVSSRLRRAHELLAPPVAEAPGSVANTAAESWADRLRELTGRDVDHCPKCGGLIEHVPLARAPPGVAA